MATFGAATAGYAAVQSSDSIVLAALKTRLPKTAVSKIDCDKIGSLCEVVAGRNLFYVDGSARYLVVGRVYDMETRQDLTSARLLELDPDRMIGGAVAAQRHADAGEAQKVAADYPIKPAPQAGQGDLQRVSLTTLPHDGAITWGHGSRSVTIFTDFRCSYCRALVNALDQMDVRVIERPISVLGSREIANRVYCSKDPARAVKSAYAGEPLPAVKCDTSGLDANERFARARGFTGTPVIVRDDGAVIEGYRPREFLETWLKGAKS
ncbi:MAG: DsbC family protein [Sphingomonadaceae bacterium]|nr:DsbC family protein [Sphingomonadaceae bacterium]